MFARSIRKTIQPQLRDDEAHAHAAAAATEAVEAIGVETARGQPAEALPRALAEAHLPTSRVAA